MTNVLDAIALTKVKVDSGKKNSHWRNANAGQIVEKLSAGSKKPISRFILTFIKRDFTFLFLN